MRIANNFAALEIYTNLQKVNKKVETSMMRISSGYKINSARDDAAGLAISNKLTNQINGLEKANANSNDGISLIQTADGALNEMQAMLQRIRELAVQAINDTNTDEDRLIMQTEVEQILLELNDTTDKTEFNKIKLLRGSVELLDDTTVPPSYTVIPLELKLQVGANQNNEISVEIPAVTLFSLDLEGVTIATQQDAELTLDRIDRAVDGITNVRSRLGAYQNRFEHTIATLSVSADNLAASRSRITDTDLAMEMSIYTQQQVISQAGISILGQANQRPQQIIALIR